MTSPYPPGLPGPGRSRARPTMRRATSEPMLRIAVDLGASAPGRPQTSRLPRDRSAGPRSPGSPRPALPWEDPWGEGRRHGRGGGNPPAPPHLEPAQADGAHRGKALHGAHPRAGAPPRHHAGRGDAGLHAAGDPRLLRRGLPPGHRARLLGRGGARRHGRQREAGRALPGRDLPGRERRCAHRHGPHRADRVPPLQGRDGDARAASACPTRSSSAS